MVKLGVKGSWSRYDHEKVRNSYQPMLGEGRLGYDFVMKVKVRRAPRYENDRPTTILDYGSVSGNMKKLAIEQIPAGSGAKLKLQHNCLVFMNGNVYNSIFMERALITEPVSVTSVSDENDVGFL